jgi:hypothetical protein
MIVFGKNWQGVRSPTGLEAPRKRRRPATFTAMSPTTDVYFSADVESDGPIPGEYSMLSFGLAVAGTYDGERFTRVDPESHTFYRELKPISERFEPAALTAIGVDRDTFVGDGTDPARAMSEAAAWIKEATAKLVGSGRPVFVAYPLGFDWMFLHWYFVRFVDEGSPFGFSSFLDIKTLYAARAGATVAASTKSQMPRQLLPQREHTHNALDDAIEQADLFANLFEWHGSAHTV